MSQDTLPSPFPIRFLTKYYYRYCSTSDVYGTAVSAAVTIVFSNTVRAECSDRPTPYDTKLCPATVYDQSDDENHYNHCASVSHKASGDQHRGRLINQDGQFWQ